MEMFQGRASFFFPKSNFDFLEEFPFTGIERACPYVCCIADSWLGLTHREVTLPTAVCLAPPYPSDTSHSVQGAVNTSSAANTHFSTHQPRAVSQLFCSHFLGRLHAWVTVPPFWVVEGRIKLWPLVLSQGSRWTVPSSLQAFDKSLLQ